jgi:3-deoxy-manno-octulosonate cytidylyltransferase (CMP-KDO synthetase)
LSTEATKVLAVIPARYGSTRLPGKPLVPLAGKPMLQHVVERVRRARSVSRTLVATDDERIVRAVESFGGEAVLTRPELRSGTERVAAVAAQVSAAVYVNVQGDEPLIEPAAIDLAVEGLTGEPEVPVATLSAAISNANDLMDPNVVKVVSDFEGIALYFSRAPIPWLRDEKPAAPTHRKHIGLYVFRRDALLDFPTLPPGILERLEQLEQLRWLENGYRIRVVESEYDSISVDVPEDVERVEKLLREMAAREKG